MTKEKEEEVYSWETKLNNCTYCGKYLGISCLSVRSKKESIGSVITMSKAHLDRCTDFKEGDKKRLSDIIIKTTSLDKKETRWVYEKMLS